MKLFLLLVVLSSCGSESSRSSWKLRGACTASGAVVELVNGSVAEVECGQCAQVENGMVQCMEAE